MKNKSEEAATRAKIEAKAEAAEKAAAEAKADLKNNTVYHECIAQYKKEMQKSMAQCINFYHLPEWMQIHEVAKEKAITQVHK